MDVDFTAEFADFVSDTEPRTRRALVAARGPEQGRIATRDALVEAWRRWSKVQHLANPTGHLYRTGLRLSQSAQVSLLPAYVQVRPSPDADVALQRRLEALPVAERASVVLHYGHRWDIPEVADVIGLPAATVRRDADRGVHKLRAELQTTVDPEIAGRLHSYADYLDRYVPSVEMTEVAEGVEARQRRRVPSAILVAVLALIVLLVVISALVLR